MLDLLGGVYGLGGCGRDGADGREGVSVAGFDGSGSKVQHLEKHKCTVHIRTYVLTYVHKYVVEHFTYVHT